jgi:anion-transporting  ArsA/GET3 family ATPase
MKKSIIAFFSLLLLYSCNKEESKTNLLLTGTIKGLKKGTLYIQRVVDTSLVAIDTIVIDGTSTFETNLKLDSPEMLYLFLDRGVTNSMDNNILFFAEPGKINIDTNLESYIASAKITGSKNQEKYEEYQKINTRFRDENLDMIEQKFNALKSNNTKVIDSLNAKQDNNTKRKYLFATNFAINNREYEVAPYIALSDIYDINLKYLDTIQKSMSPKVAKSLYGKKLTDYVAKIRKEQ